MGKELTLIAVTHLCSSTVFTSPDTSINDDGSIEILMSLVLNYFNWLFNPGKTQRNGYNCKYRKNVNDTLYAVLKKTDSPNTRQKEGDCIKYFFHNTLFYMLFNNSVKIIHFTLRNVTHCW